MPKIDHDASGILRDEMARDDASALPLATLRRCHRLRQRSRSAVRARIRLGLMISLAVVLLLILALQGSIRWMQIDMGLLLKSSALVLGAMATTYVVALLAAVAIMRRRRTSLSRISCDAVTPSA